MIIYNTRKRFGYSLLCHFVGSALPVSFVYAVVAFVLSLVIKSVQLNEFGSDYIDEISPKFVAISFIKESTISMKPMLTIIGFLLVIRTNLAYQRWWEASNYYTEMRSLLDDIALQCSAFTQHKEFRIEAMRLLMLFHGLSLIHLSGRVDLEEEASFYQQVLVTKEEKHKLNEIGSGPLLVMRWLQDHIVEYWQWKGFGGEPNCGFISLSIAPVVCSMRLMS